MPSLGWLRERAGMMTGMDEMAKPTRQTTDAHDSRPGDTRIALVILVDRRGYLLLRHRDDDAPVYPDRWALPGDRVEADEPPDAAARRGLLELTGLVVEQRLTLFMTHTGARAHPRRGRVERFVYVAASDARQEEIARVEGRAMAMVFVAPAVALTLDLIPAARDILATFLASPEYEQIVSSHPARH